MDREKSAGGLESGQGNNFFKVLESRYGDLFNVEKKIADFILKNTDMVLSSTISRFSRKCDVSEGSIVNFCRSLGYDGFKDFKIKLAKDIGSVSRLVHEDIKDTDDVKKVAEKVFNSSMLALQETLDGVDFDMMEEAARLVIHSGRINLFSSGTSIPIALNAFYKFGRLGLNCHMLSEPYMQTLAFAMMKESDLNIIISHSGRTKSMVDAARAIKEKNARIIGLSGDENSPLILVSDIRLISRAKETTSLFEPVSSRIAQYALIDTLYVNIAIRMADTSVEGMRNIEKHLKKQQYSK